MPVEGDWIVIGVLAEKSDIKMIGSSANATAAAKAAQKAKKLKMAREQAAKKKKKKKNEKDADKDALDDMMNNQAKSDQDLKEAGEDSDQGETYANKQKPRRYINFKLLDLKHRNAGGGQGVLNLRLFESDPLRTGTKQDGSNDDDAEETVTNTGVKLQKEREDLTSRRKRTDYKGGSGGAYEKFWKEREGTVVAILNPKIMKPWSVSLPTRFEKIL